MLTIGQLAKRVGLRPSALRYYEREGLLAPDGRSEAGYRLYQPQSEQRLRFIQRAQRLAHLETNCHAHAQAMPQFAYDDEGYLFTATGDRAFIFARLFLALEHDHAARFVKHHDLV